MNPEILRRHESAEDDGGLPLGPPMSETTISKDSLIDPEIEPVLANLMELRDEGREVGSYLVESALHDIDNILVFGEPGNGKTKVMTELKSAIERNASARGIEVTVSMLFYDDFLAQMEGEFGPRNRWSREKWIMLNERMHNAIRDQQESAREKTLKDLKYDTTVLEQLEESWGKSCDWSEDQLTEYESAQFEYQKNKLVEHPQRWINLIEVPGVGSIKERDRGVSTSRQLFADARDIGDTICMLVPRIRLVQARTSMIRASVADGSMTEAEIVEWLSFHSIVLEGNWDPKEAGRRVKGLLKKAAQAHHIAKIRKEELDKIHAWNEKATTSAYFATLKDENNASRNAGDYDVLNMLKKNLNVPPLIPEERVRELYTSFGAQVDDTTVKQMAEEMQQEALDQALYYEELMRDVYGLDSSKGIIAFNPYNTASMVIDRELLDKVKAA